jgi:hypothetical protein
LSFSFWIPQPFKKAGADLRRGSDFHRVYETKDGADLAGLNWSGIRITFSKMQQLKITSTLVGTSNIC